METRDSHKAQVPTLESWEMASYVGVGGCVRQIGQALGMAADLWVTSCSCCPQVESLPQGSHISAHLFD